MWQADIQARRADLGTGGRAGRANAGMFGYRGMATTRRSDAIAIIHTVGGACRCERKQQALVAPPASTYDEMKGDGEMDKSGLWKVKIPVEGHYEYGEEIELEIWFNSEEGMFAVSPWGDSSIKHSSESIEDVFTNLGITAEDCQKAFWDGEQEDDDTTMCFYCNDVLRDCEVKTYHDKRTCDACHYLLVEYAKSTETEANNAN